MVEKRADDVLDALDAARAAGLVIEVGVDRHRFAHALVRETLHGELSSSRRARQHRKVATVLEARHANNLDGVVTELATHWAAASAGGDPSRAIELAIRAGDLAIDRGGYENAATWYSDALELIDDDATSNRTKRQTHVKLASIQTESAVLLKDAATPSLPPTQQSAPSMPKPPRRRCRFRLESVSPVSKPPDPERVALLREALALALTTLTPVHPAALVGALATELIFERDIAGREAALVEYETPIAQLDSEALATLREGAGNRRFAGDRPYLANVVSHRKEQLGRTRNLTDSLVTAGNLYFYSLGLGDRTGVDIALESLRARSDRAPGIAVGLDHLLHSMDRTIAGDLAGGESAARVMFAFMTSMSSPEAALYRTTTHWPTPESSARSVDSLGSPTALLAWVIRPVMNPAIAAFIRFFSGQTDAILPALDRLDTEEFSDDAGYSVTVAYWSEIAAAIGTVEQRQRFIDVLQPMSTLNILGGGIYLGPVDRLLALLHDSLGEPDRADEYFATAIQLQEAIVSPPWIARCHLDWAESLLARSETDRARINLQPPRCRSRNRHP